MTQAECSPAHLPSLRLPLPYLAATNPFGAHLPAQLPALASLSVALLAAASDAVVCNDSSGSYIRKPPASSALSRLPLHLSPLTVATAGLTVCGATGSSLGAVAYAVTLPVTINKPCGLIICLTACLLLPLLSRAIWSVVLPARALICSAAPSAALIYSCHLTE